MSIHKNVGFDSFPKQGKDLNREVELYFWLGVDRSPPVRGKIVRDDVGEPYIRIIQLSDGRCVVNGEYKEYVLMD